MLIYITWRTGLRPGVLQVSTDLEFVTARQAIFEPFVRSYGWYRYSAWFSLYKNRLQLQIESRIFGRIYSHSEKMAREVGWWGYICAPRLSPSNIFSTPHKVQIENLTPRQGIQPGLSRQGPTASTAWQMISLLS